jgi:hypothetical protein
VPFRDGVKDREADVGTMAAEIAAILLRDTELSNAMPEVFGPIPEVVAGSSGLRASAGLWGQMETTGLQSSSITHNLALGTPEQAAISAIF